MYYSGRVQGVGFRQTTCDAAQGLAVSGYVRNLPDGRVQLVVSGHRESIEQLLTTVRQRLGCFIRHENRDDAPAAETSEEASLGFRIRR